MANFSFFGFFVFDLCGGFFFAFWGGPLQFDGLVSLLINHNCTINVIEMRHWCVVFTNFAHSNKHVCCVLDWKGDNYYALRAWISLLGHCQKYKNLLGKRV